jgi:hypothetical protein
LYCDDPLLLVDVNFTVFKRIRELSKPNTQKQLPPGTKSAENPQFGNHKHGSIKTLRIREENPAVWYSITYANQSSLPMFFLSQ